MNNHRTSRLPNALETRKLFEIILKNLNWPCLFFCARTLETTPFQILPRRNRRGTKTLNDYVHERICRSLSFRHRKRGYIYAFQAKSNPGYIKIGYTTGPVLERLRSLIFDCNREMKVLFPTPPESVETVPNAWRVEELCHAELVDYQVQVDCTGCLSEHREWF